MDNDLLGPRRHYRGTDWHLLDLNAIGELEVVLANLLGEVEVLLALYWCARRVFDGFDSIKPFDASGANVTEHDDAERVSVDSGEDFPVHFPGQHDFINFNLGPGNTDEVVHGLVVLEVGIGPVELQMFSALDQTTAGFDDLLETNPDILRGTNSTLSSWSLRNFVTLTGILEDLFNTAGPGTLHRNGLLHPRKLGLVHEVVQSE